MFFFFFLLWVLWTFFFSWALRMAHIIGHATKNSLATMLDPSQPSSLAPPSSDTNSSQPPHLLSSSHKVPHSGLLTSLRHLVTSHYGSLAKSLNAFFGVNDWCKLVGKIVSGTMSSGSIAKYPPLSSTADLSTGSIVVPSHLVRFLGPCHPWIGHSWLVQVNLVSLRTWWLRMRQASLSI